MSNQRLLEKADEVYSIQKQFCRGPPLYAEKLKELKMAIGVKTIPRCTSRSEYLTFSGPLFD